MESMAPPTLASSAAVTSPLPCSLKRVCSVLAFALPANVAPCSLPPWPPAGVAAGLIATAYHHCHSKPRHSRAPAASGAQTPRHSWRPPQAAPPSLQPEPNNRRPSVPPPSSAHGKKFNTLWAWFQPLEPMAGLLSGKSSRPFSCLSQGMAVSNKRARHSTSPAQTSSCGMVEHRSQCQSLLAQSKGARFVVAPHPKQTATCLLSVSTSLCCLCSSSLWMVALVVHARWKLHSIHRRVLTDQTDAPIAYALGGEWDLASMPWCHSHGRACQATRVFGLLVDTQRPPALQDSEGHRRDEARPSNDAQDHDEVHRKA